MPTCPAILVSGARVGEVCGKSAPEGQRCGIHFRMWQNVVERRMTAQKELVAIFNKNKRTVMTHAQLEQFYTWAETMYDYLEDNVPVGNAFPYGGPQMPAIPPPPPRRPARQRRAVAPPPEPIPVPVHVPAHRPRRARAAPAAAPPPPAPDNLAVFANDNQNVHTTQSVNMTKQVVERVLRIPVPEEFRWNMDTISKTAGEILVDCKLNHAEMIEMMNRYMRDDDVYEMGKGIYGKVLDGVWQYIRTSPDKADLCVILKQELKDNIGMCAQGNLTRLCNVLAGYMDGIGNHESAAERVGRLLPKLMEIEDEEKRVSMGKEVLRESGVVEAEWGAWLEALTA